MLVNHPVPAAEGSPLAVPASTVTEKKKIREPGSQRLYNTLFIHLLKWMEKPFQLKYLQLLYKNHHGCMHNHGHFIL